LAEQLLPFTSGIDVLLILIFSQVHPWAANTIFSTQFSEKLFREQLSFHKDIDYSETVDYIEDEVPENEIREYLIEKAVEI
jgi:hypothetical protein